MIPGPRRKRPRLNLVEQPGIGLEALSVQEQDLLDAYLYVCRLSLPKLCTATRARRIIAQARLNPHVMEAYEARRDERRRRHRQMTGLRPVV